MSIKKILITILLYTGILIAIPLDMNLSSSNQTSQALKTALKKSPSILLKNIPQKKILRNFYRKNNYSPLWLTNNKFNKEKYTKLFGYIQNDITLDQKGLIYKNYKTLAKQVDNNLTQIQKLHIELKFSSLYYNFLVHTIYGEIQWKKFAYKLSSLKKRKINASWIKSKPKFNLEKLMKNDDIDAILSKVNPKYFGYQGLLLALEKLETLKEKGTWKKLPSFKRLALGSTGDIVLKLRSRLKVSGDYLECNETETCTISTFDTNISNDINLSRDAVFGHCLDNAVKTFQQRHGLVVDGIVGEGTRKTLNISIDDKIRKIRLNIDRIKWLPREEQKRFIVVNIPEFMLHYVEDGKTKQNLRVIVGDTKHPTPIFSQKISFVVLNPYWKIPEGIVKREIVPAMIKNPNYLRQQGLVAHRTWSENSRIIDTSWLYWEDYLYGEKFPYRLMQPPGPRNALGKIKFKFPNRFAVYLHDTPTRHLFKRNTRAFSHGCVRLSNPRELLETIATFNTNIDIRKAKKVLKGKHKKQLNMEEKLRIYLVYLTAGMNKKGQIQFRNDIYNYDKYQKRRLR
jgi:murein L,D-transpeptidase YcbB/YkuD